MKKFILMSDRYSSMFNELVNKLVNSVIALVAFILCNVELSLHVIYQLMLLVSAKRLVFRRSWLD